MMDIEEFVTAAMPRLRKGTRDLMLDVLWRRVVQASVKKAGTNHPIPGWPIGRERGRGHSKDMFEIDSTIRGNLVVVRILNYAPWSGYIYQKGSRRARLVKDREIVEAINRELPELGNRIARLFGKTKLGR